MNAVETTVKQIRESSFDIKATGRLNRLYIELLKDNPEWAKAARREDLNHFMARLIFCFFAEDTDIFHGEGLFSSTVEQMSAGDPSKTGEVISELFRAMNVPIWHEGKISNFHRDAAGIRNWANVFPYVNGGLFGPPGSADLPVGTANGKANGKAVNDPSLTSHSQANEDVGVPNRADLPVGTANGKANGKDGSAPSLTSHSQAKERNDETLARIYIGRRFKNDTERLEKLFELYPKMAGAPTSPSAQRMKKPMNKP